MSLKTFNETSGIYPGINTPQFSQLDYLIESSKRTGQQMPHLGLFGEASTGKTTSAGIIANAIGASLIHINCASLSDRKFNLAMCENFARLKDSSIFSGICYSRNDSGRMYYTKRPLVVLLDEAHELSKGIQTRLLSLIDSPGVIDPSQDTVNTKNITWVFATTDSSKLVYPLTTRMFSVMFEQYTADDIASILSIRYKNIEAPALAVLASCSKFIPRVAIQYAKQLSSSYAGKITLDQAILFAKNFLNMDPNGIDHIDKKILLYLAHNKKKVAPVDEISLRAFEQQVERFVLKGIDKLTPSEHKQYNAALFKVAILKHKITTTEYSFKSRQDISLGCNILDLGNLEVRLSFLEKLNYVTKSPKGICLCEQYL